MEYSYVGSMKIDPLKYQKAQSPVRAQGENEKEALDRARLLLPAKHDKQKELFTSLDEVVEQSEDKWEATIEFSLRQIYSVSASGRNYEDASRALQKKTPRGISFHTCYVWIVGKEEPHMPPNEDQRIQLTLWYIPKPEHEEMLAKQREALTSS